MTATPCVHHASSVEEALEQLDRSPDAEILAGGTWIMRAPQRGEPFADSYVALAGIQALHRIEMRDETVALGALLTHAQLAAIEASPAFAAVATAARLSAFPAIRAVATLGGNLRAQRFPEADLVPALLAVDATVQTAGRIVTGVSVPTPAGRHSGFARLTVRGGGEYAVASVSVSVDLHNDVVRAARLAIGGVEEAARSLPDAANVLVGTSLDADAVTRAGEAAAATCNPRDGLDAPGWYRRAVVPGLVRRAIDDMRREA